ncbi:MAG: tetratricopeptide repeat protein [Verrucomicrobiota bacterium]
MKKRVQIFLICAAATLPGWNVRAASDVALKNPGAIPSGALSNCVACQIILVAPHGHDESDQAMLKLQQRIKTSPLPGPFIEQLGWRLVSKARTANDPGLYNLVEQCALCLEAQQPENPAAWLLRGHALQSLHKFKEAEPVARKLVAKRGASFDFGLLGDVLMDRGQVTEGIAAYQKMMDLKPDLHSYTRAAHARWIKGDVTGALELISMATSAGSSRDAEATAWSYTRRAAYEMQLNQPSDSLHSVRVALRLQPDDAAAWFFQGRIQLMQGQTNDALPSLQRAVSLSPLPEYQWILADVLNLVGKPNDSVEANLHKRGAQEDPRSFALYLATRREQPEAAVKLTERELAERADIFTHDALAWALFAAGKFPEARQQSTLALTEGTEDARLFFHAAIIAEVNGDSKQAVAFSQKVAPIQQMLFPSEQQQLAELNGRLVGALTQAKITETSK